MLSNHVISILESSSAYIPPKVDFNRDHDRPSVPQYQIFPIPSSAQPWNKLQSRISKLAKIFSLRASASFIKLVGSPWAGFAYSPG